MAAGNEGLRLEERFLSSWQDKNTSNCIWWQGEWWSWNRLNALADDCQKKIADAGFGRGERIAVMLPNSPMVLALSIACWRLGGAVATLNVRTGPVNLLSTIKMLDVSAVFVTEEKYVRALEVGEGTEIPVIAASLDLPLKNCFMRRATSDKDETAMIFSTSGTSGLPKAVPCTHQNILANIDDVPDAAPGLLDESSVFLNVLPNFHTFGFNMGGLLPLLSGIRQVLVPSFVPVDNTVAAIKNSGANIIIAVPTVMAFLLGALAKKDERIRGIKFIISGGDRLNTEMDSRCIEYLGTGILEGYGLTECSPVVAFNSSMQERRIGTVGRKFKSLELEIRDREGSLLGLHDEGVLWIKGPSVVSGYFRDAANTAERFKNGWFNTGDVVKIDDDGFIKIVDRATDIIIVGGFNVYPQEVEAVLNTHPAVRSAVAVGEPNNITGELVKVFVILNDSCEVTTKELTNFCKKRLAHYKVPRKMAFVTEYLISAAGKILRRELRKIKIDK